MPQSESIRYVVGTGLAALLAMGASVNAGQVSGPCGVASTAVASGGASADLFGGVGPAAPASDQPKTWFAVRETRADANASVDDPRDDPAYSGARSELERTASGTVDVSLNRVLAMAPTPNDRMVHDVAMGRGVEDIDRARAKAISAADRAALAFIDTDLAPSDLDVAAAGQRVRFLDLLPELAIGAALVVIGCFAVRHRRMWA